MRQLGPLEKNVLCGQLGTKKLSSTFYQAVQKSKIQIQILSGTLVLLRPLMAWLNRRELVGNEGVESKVN